MIGPRLKDLGRWYSGGTPPTERHDLWDGGVPWISGKDFDKTRLRLPSKFTTAEGATGFSRLMPGDRSVLLLVRGMALAHGLPVAHLHFDAAINQDVRGLVVDEGFDARFIHYSLSGRRSELDVHIDRAAHGTARVRDTLYAHRLNWVPDRDRQRTIADFLDRECERIQRAAARGSDVERRLRDSMDHFVSNAVSHLTMTRLRFGWRVIDCKHRTPQYLDADETGFPVVSTREVTPGRLVVDEATRRVSRADFDDLRDGGRVPQAGDIIYSRNARLGVAALVTDGQEVCMGQDVVLITRTRGSSALLAYVLNHAVGEQVRLAAIGTTFDRINVPVIRDLVVPMGSPEEEASIVARLDDVSAAVASATRGAERISAALVEYRDALIHEAVTSELDVCAASEMQMEERLHAAAEGRRDEVPV